MERSSADVVLRAYIHCQGCARDASQCLSGFAGVEGVAIDAANQRITVKGTIVDPLKVLQRLRKKFSRNVELISPVPQPQPVKQQEASPKEEEITIRTAVLRLPMHCNGCAKDIERSIYKMKGVLKVEPEMENGMVTVTGAFEDSRLLKYSRKHLSKYADIVIPVEQQPAEDDKAKDDKANDSHHEQAVVLYQPWNSTCHTCPCQMFNDENTDSCRVM